MKQTIVFIADLFYYFVSIVSCFINNNNNNNNKDNNNNNNNNNNNKCLYCLLDKNTYLMLQDKKIKSSAKLG